MADTIVKNSVDVWAVKGSPESDAFSQMEYWLAHPLIRERQNIRFSGHAKRDWLEYACATYLDKKDHTKRSVLSIGCGNGSTERAMHQMGIFANCDAFDYSKRSIERAQAEAVKEGISTINYYVGDGNEVKLEKNKYDLVIFNMSLHHIQNLEHLLQEVNSSLRENGKVFIHEYVGPNRFDFTDRQKQVIRAMYALIPRRYLMSRSGEFKTEECFPNPKDVERDDPTESVRSVDIPKVVNEFFSVLETRRGYGTTLQFLLAGIAGNFRNNDPASIKVLEMLLNIEETLLDVHDLCADFLLIIAQKRAVPVQGLVAAGGDY